MKSTKTWVDPRTGLEWEAEQNPSPMTWEEAMAYASECRTEGHADWRLPTIKELTGVIDYSRSHPATALPNMGGWFWSSSSYAGVTTQVWCVDSCSGSESPGGKTVSNVYVRCARAVSRLPSGPALPP